jgi:hypothetical protein
VWIIAVAVCTTIMPAPVALYVAMVWLIGTALVIHTVGLPAGFAYSATVGCASFLVTGVVLALIGGLSIGRAEHFVLLFMASVWLGLQCGGVIWGLAAAADAVFKQYVRRLVG